MGSSTNLRGLDTREFRGDLGVFVCHHVFEHTAPVLLSVRNWDGSWQFLCGGELSQDPVHLVHVAALLTRDSSLGAMATLEPGSFAKRATINDTWKRGELEPEGEGRDGA